MIKRPLIAVALVLAVSAAHAQSRYPLSGNTPRGPMQSDQLGPRSNPTPTVGESVARLQIEKAGYSSVRGLWRGPDGSWHGMARNGDNAAVPVVLDGQGKVAEIR